MSHKFAKKYSNEDLVELARAIKKVHPYTSPEWEKVAERYNAYVEKTAGEEGTKRTGSALKKKVKAYYPVSSSTASPG